MTVLFVYITVGNRDEAVAIGRTLVEERLAACANIIDNVTSFYWWEDEVQEDAEAVVVAKTTEQFIEELIERVKSLHSYSCPCVVSWPIGASNAAYLSWIAEQTRPDS